MSADEDDLSEEEREAIREYLQNETGGITSWFSDLSDEAKELLDEPKVYILSAVTTWLIGGIETIATALVGGIRLIFEPLLVAIDALGLGLLEPVRLFNTLLLDTWGLIEGIAFEVVRGAGITSPIVATGLAVGIALGLTWVGYRTVITIGRNVPGVRSGLNFLGLN